MPKISSLVPDETYSGPTIGPSTGYELLYDPGLGGRRELPIVNPPLKTSQYVEPGLSSTGIDPTTDFLPLGWMKKLAEMGVISAKAVLGFKGAAIGATAYHGSPYKFDKFSMNKVGTGEGAQAYGHGLYFSENPNVAKQYLPKQAGDLDYDILKGAWKVIKGKTQSGNLYKVDIPDEAIGKMLDWDKQLPKKHRNLAWDLPPNATGKDLYEYLRKTMNDQEISFALREAGIPGIKYLDQGSREVGKGTRNFVLFDENLPNILESK